MWYIVASNGIIEINKGDVVTIVTNNRVITGEVIYANWIDADNGWHIGLVNTGTGLYTLWKQGISGGEVVKINGKMIVM